MVREILTERLEVALRARHWKAGRRLIDPMRQRRRPIGRPCMQTIQAMPRPSGALPSTGSGVTVCVLHHNRLGKLAELLASIPQTIDGNPVEVVIIDNASSMADARKEILAIAGERPLVRIIALAEPLPPAAAHNRGLAEARFETVLFSDDDNIFMPDGVQRLAHAVAQSEFDIVVSALDVFDDGSRSSASNCRSPDLSRRRACGRLVLQRLRRHRHGRATGQVPGPRRLP